MTSRCEITPHRAGPEHVRELGVVVEPVRVPGGPVGVVAGRDPADDVVGLGCFVEELGSETTALEESEISPAGSRYT